MTPRILLRIYLRGGRASCLLHRPPTDTTAAGACSVRVVRRSFLILLLFNSSGSSSGSSGSDSRRSSGGGDVLPTKNIEEFLPGFLCPLQSAGSNTKVSSRRTSYSSRSHHAEETTQHNRGRVSSVPRTQLCTGTYCVGMLASVSPIAHGVKQTCLFRTSPLVPRPLFHGSQVQRPPTQEDRNEHTHVHGLRYLHGLQRQRSPKLRHHYQGKRALVFRILRRPRWK